MAIQDFYQTTAYFYNRDVTINDLGGQTISYSNVSNVAAYIANIISANEVVFNGKENVIATDELTCGTANVKNIVSTDMICIVDGNTYDILDVWNTFKSHHMVIKLRRVGNPLTSGG